MSRFSNFAARKNHRQDSVRELQFECRVLQALLLQHLKKLSTLYRSHRDLIQNTYQAKVAPNL